MNFRSRTPLSYCILFSIALAAIWFVARPVAAQDEIKVKHNADGSKTTFENLPGGAVRATTTDAKGNVVDVVTSEPNSKYGKGGSKITLVRKIDGNDTVIELYKDAAGAVKALSFTDNNPKGYTSDKYQLDVEFSQQGQLKAFQEKMDDRIVDHSEENSTPDGTAELESRFRTKAAELRKVIEDNAYQRLGISAATTTASEKGTDKPPDKSESKTPNNENPGRSTIPSSQPKIVPSDIVNYLTNVKEFTGLYTVQFIAPNKDTLEVYLPRHLFPGPNMGSMHLIPSGSPDAGRSFKNEKLRVGDTTMLLADEKFWSNFVPGEWGKIRLTDGDGRSLGGIDFPVTDRNDAPSARDLPASATVGELIEVDFPPAAKLAAPLVLGKGPDPFEVKIGDQEMPIIAANRFGLVTREDYNHPGPTYFQIKIGEEVFKTPLRVLTLKLSAGSLDLLKGESTTVHIVVGGLENLKAPAHMTIVTSGSVTMTGATAVEIDPKMVASDGTYITDRSLHAIAAGGFGVNVTVKVDKEP